MELVVLCGGYKELTRMLEHCRDQGSVWVTLKRLSLKSKAQRTKVAATGKPLDFRCLVRATNGKKKISTSVGAKDQASYATILEAHMTSLKKRERKDKKKTDKNEKKPTSF